MCTVEKILIKGIRSFSPENEYIIEFYKPLTIIVGSNGAGKTTIIECLRNATTGELPPNTRQGHGFVHDPKVACESEVKAQIKLSFKTGTGQPIYVTRSFQLTQKKTALQFKSLDAVLTCRNRHTGQRESVTYRCADLDRMVPTLMGVSKAVLENVIFVHQEESNWPLAEGKVLKDKFDDIFAATKYTKALEALRKLRTEKSQALKEYKLSLETLRQIKDMATHHTADRDAAKAKVADAQGQLGSFEARIKDLEQQRSGLTSRLAEIEGMCREVTAKRGQLEQLRATNREREERFRAEGHEEFEESSEALRDHLAAADQVAADKQERVRVLEGELSAARAAREAVEAQYQRDLVLNGQLAGEATAHASNVADRDRAIRATAVALSLQLPPSLLAGVGAGGGAVSGAEAEAFREAVAGRVRELESRLAALRADVRSNDDRLSSAVEGASTQVARAQEGLRLKRVQLEENRNAISACGAQIQGSQHTEVSARALREEAERAEEYYTRKQAEESTSDLPRQVDSARSEVEGLGRRITELRAERQRAAAAAEGSAKLRLKRTDLESKEEQLRKVLTARRLDLCKALGLPLQQSEALPEPSALRPRHEALLRQLREEEAARLRDSQNAHRAAEAAKNSLHERDSEVRRAAADLDRLQAELQTGIAAAAAAAGAGGGSALEGDYHNLVASVQRAEDKRRNRLGKANAMQTMLGSYRDLVRQGHDCPLCHRGFREEERTTALQYIEQDLKELPASISECQSAVQQLQRQLEALRALQPTWVRVTDLQARLPGLRAARNAVSTEADDLAEKASALQLDYAEALERVKEVAALGQDVVWALDRLAAEVEGLRREVAALEAPGGGGPFASSRSVSEIDADLEAAEAARQRAEVDRDGAQQRISRLHDEVLHAQRLAMSAQQRALEAAAAVNKVNELQSKISELEAANTTLEADLRSAAATLAPLEAERDRLARQREERRQAAHAEVAAMEEQLRHAKDLQAELQSKLRLVAEYEGRGRAAELTRVAAELERLRGRLEGEGRALAAREEELAAIRQELVADAALRRDVLDQLELRTSREQEEELGKEIAAVQERVAQVGDMPALQRQAASLAEQRDTLRSQQDVLRGHMAAAQQQAARAQAELNEAKYRDVWQRFHGQQVTVKTTEMALSDLEKYYKALEKSLLIFHTTKMADINKVIKELWQKTYRGQDIDYIQIKADTEGAGARSYNYRVVMYSGAAELDMRGRCSAGQKVLACLIIRLALAETFCLNCGILALDEPTTNLDAENAASLARALKALMESRSGQENFQLIVITHDEMFAQLIGTREHVDTLWRVTKDPATQHTLVTPEALRD